MLHCQASPTIGNQLLKRSNSTDSSWTGWWVCNFRKHRIHQLPTPFLCYARSRHSRRQNRKKSQNAEVINTVKQVLSIGCSLSSFPPFYSFPTGLAHIILALSLPPSCSSFFKHENSLHSPSIIFIVNSIIFIVNSIIFIFSFGGYLT